MLDLDIRYENFKAYNSPSSLRGAKRKSLDIRDGGLEDAPPPRPQESIRNWYFAWLEVTHE